MSFAADDFLHSLARYLVARAAGFTPPISIVYDAQGAGLFRWSAPENFADADLYSVLAITGGLPSPKHPQPVILVQCRTHSKSNKAGSTQSQALFDAASNNDGSPVRMLTIPAFSAADGSAQGSWQIVSIDWVQRPGLVGRDDRGRAMFSFNLQVGVGPLTS